MPQAERETPELLAKAPSRRRRIARGSGHAEMDVSNMLAMFANMRSKMQDLSKLMNMSGAAAGALPCLFSSYHCSFCCSQVPAAMHTRLCVFLVLWQSFSGGGMHRDSV